MKSLSYVGMALLFSVSQELWGRGGEEGLGLLACATSRPFSGGQSPEDICLVAVLPLGAQLQDRPKQSNV
jgi:hypothetical protein